MKKLVLCSTIAAVIGCMCVNNDAVADSKMKYGCKASAKNTYSSVKDDDYIVLADGRALTCEVVADSTCQAGKIAMVTGKWAHKGKKHDGDLGIFECKSSATNDFWEPGHWKDVKKCDNKQMNEWKIFTETENYTYRTRGVIENIGNSYWYDTRYMTGNITDICKQGSEARASYKGDCSLNITKGKHFYSDSFINLDENGALGCSSGEKSRACGAGTYVLVKGWYMIGNGVKHTGVGAYECKDTTLEWKESKIPYCTEDQICNWSVFGTSEGYVYRTGQAFKKSGKSTYVIGERNMCIHEASEKCSKSGYKK